ncbi:hypothetical protein M406DRAFT_260517 [Cryphonectria parasitica EP155]|uniref:Uncharacterized protein n=1 Tax=Cryphonectria parasitica (strain ATCC 38755 / EP155) TaxID=660469 RepID=A0A9P4Y0V1_CRYP1|nr:uncharacterized protein M406DRAFT_260517 [Cryphonectria parasitica EP155]KAF3764919.1 hypothetical protein M406DRAFT_260517 [Cryphonectria parasitica EP155]
MSSPSATAPSQGDAPQTRQSAIYKIIMTPVIFVSFLFSLAWVEFRYSLMRSHFHSSTQSWMPDWIHHILYREAPYQYVRADPKDPRTPTTEAGGSRWYYRTKQRKLLKMEVEDAFRIRGSVLVVLGLLAVGGTWAAWRAVCWAWTALTAKYS